MNPKIEIIIGDCRETLRTLPDKSVQCAVTSPPYFGLRDYGSEAQIGREQTPEEYIAELVTVFREVWRVLKDDGMLWLNLGDSYAVNGGARTYGSTDGATGRADAPAGARRAPKGYKVKDLIGIPWMAAFALRDEGWYLRRDIIWAKPNPMPESVADRPTTAHEYVFMLTKSADYFYDSEASREPASQPNRTRDGVKHSDGSVHRNRRSVWTVPLKPYKGAHFATYPPDLIRPCILCGSRPGDTVIDPFGGSGTTGEVALSLGRSAILCELNPEYAALARTRTATTIGLPL